MDHVAAFADHRPMSELFTDAINQFSKLVRNEVALARAEIALKGERGGGGHCHVGRRRLAC